MGQFSVFRQYYSINKIKNSINKIKNGLEWLKTSTTSTYGAFKQIVKLFWEHLLEWLNSTSTPTYEAFKALIIYKRLRMAEKTYFINIWSI